MSNVWMWDFEVHDVIGVIGYQPPPEKEAKPRGPNFQILFLQYYYADWIFCRKRQTKISFVFRFFELKVRLTGRKISGFRTLPILTILWTSGLDVMSSRALYSLMCKVAGNSKILATL